MSHRKRAWRRPGGLTLLGELRPEHCRHPGPRPHHGALDDFRRRFRSELRSADREFAGNGVPAASSYCFDVVAEWGSDLLSSLASVLRICVGYSCYDNGHRFTRRE